MNGQPCAADLEPRMNLLQRAILTPAAIGLLGQPGCS